MIDIINELKNYNANVHIYDPWADAEEAQHEYGLDLIDSPKANSYDAIILCVGHSKFRELGAEEIRTYGKTNHVLFDVKHILPKDAVDARL